MLAELFQFDAADLDFGIYHIMNHKRYEVQRFITEDLPAAVAQELDRDALSQRLVRQNAINAQFTLMANWHPLWIEGLVMVGFQTLAGHRHSLASGGRAARFPWVNS